MIQRSRVNGAGAVTRLLLLGVLLGLASCTESSVGQGRSEKTPDSSKATPDEPFYDGLGHAEIALAQAATQNALEHLGSGASGRWHSRATGESGSVTPLRTFKTTDGFFCREFSETIATRVGERSAQRLACRDREGRWRPALAGQSPQA